ncbi:FMN reductase [Advenella sp. S44]|uniref:FMN reductase n=1 Tax=Advenella sp. S44 TaxID=1982755 RepID=UPI000C2AE5FE|nr:FMN reductase [Advenella sp. S44]PJX28086.1 FMN reductase [Advenella sp. S44]
MSRFLNTVVINGSLHRPSRTRVLLEEVTQKISHDVALQTQFIDLIDLVPCIGTAMSKDDLNTVAKQALQRIEHADFLIVGAPVFRGSVPGLFKHLFDLIDMDALAGKPALLAATGGSPRHGLVIDHQLRTLFGFFHALSLPAGIYATSAEIQDGKIVSETLAKRLELVASLAAPVLNGVVNQQRHNIAERAVA